jgi:hypothetical protein
MMPSFSEAKRFASKPSASLKEAKFGGGIVLVDRLSDRAAGEGERDRDSGEKARVIIICPPP